MIRKRVSSVMILLPLLLAACGSSSSSEPAPPGAAANDAGANDAGANDGAYRAVLLPYGSRDFTAAAASPTNDGWLVAMEAVDSATAALEVWTVRDGNVLSANPERVTFPNEAAALTQCPAEHPPEFSASPPSQQTRLATAS